MVGLGAERECRSLSTDGVCLPSDPEGTTCSRAAAVSIGGTGGMDSGPLAVAGNGHGVDGDGPRHRGVYPVRRTGDGQRESQSALLMGINAGAALGRGN